MIVLKLENRNAIDSFLSIYSMHIPSLNQSADPYDYRTYYDKQTLGQVFQLYRKDIMQFEYESEYTLLLNYLDTPKAGIANVKSNHWETESNKSEQRSEQ